MSTEKPEQTFALGGILFLSSGFLALSFASGLSVSSILIALCGLLSHFIYCHVDRYRTHVPAGYIPSGEVLPALAVMTFLYHAGSGIVPVSAAGLTCIFLCCLPSHFFLNGSRRSLLYAGTCLNGIFVLSLLFGFYSRGAFPLLSSSPVAGGLLRSFKATVIVPPAVCVIILVSLLVAHSSRHIRLYYHGAGFFHITGYPYRAASLSMVCIRSVLLFSTVMCGGLLYGWFLPVPGKSRGTLSYLAGSLFPFSCFLLVSVTAGTWIAVFLSIALSYSHLLYNSRG